MPKFITIHYGDRDGYERTPTEVRDAAHAHDADLRRQGATMGVAGTPVQIRNHSGAGIRTEVGAFLNAALPVAGFALIEAADIDQAVRIAAESPCAVAYGVVEIWPLEDPPLAA